MPGSARLVMGAWDWVLLLLLSLLWGGAFLLTRFAVETVPPFTLVLARTCGAALILGVLLAATGRSLPRGGQRWAGLLLMGLLNNALPFALLAWAQTRIGSGLAAILNAGTPLFAALLGHLATRDEPVRPGRLAGVAVGLAGVAIVIGHGAIGGDLPAELACLAAAFSYALAAIFGRRLGERDPTVIATGQLVTASLLLAPFALGLERPWAMHAPDLSVWAAIAGLALFATALAYILYFRLLADIGATNTCLVTLLIPVTALLLGSSVLGENAAPHQLAGMAVIGLGLALIDGRPAGALLRRLRPATSR